AKRSRLLLQLLVESVTLSATGGALGLLLAAWGARVLVAMVKGPFSPQLDWRVLGFTAAVSILTGIVFGMAPALRGLRFDLTPALKSAESGVGSRARRRRFSLGNLLVTTQVALAVVVLATAGLLVRTLTNLKTLDPGFNTNNLLLFGLDPRHAGYKDAQVDRLYGQLQEKLAALPGVKSVGYSWVPLLGGGLMSTSFHRPGTPIDSKDQVDADQLEVGPNFFATLGIPIQMGREFTAADFTAAASRSYEKPGSPPWPAVVNQTLAQSYFPNQNPLGVVMGDSPAEGSFPAFPGFQIIGVAGDAKYNSLRRDIKPTLYTPASGGDAFFEVRTAINPASLIPAVQRTVSGIDDNLALFQIKTQQERIDMQLTEDRLVAQLSSFFGLLALVLACMGLYGLLAYEVSRRTREIGIRMAIGAQAGNVIRLVMGEAVLVAALGAVAGISLSLGVCRLLTTLLYGVKPGDPITLVGVTLLLALVAAAACLFPARRATRVDPLVALRYE
ncbi:MAG TPA: FtsX-like permease family protein, partial [Terriglobales bacterium]|nr:FtsX-like permease family protein [Terriglobales bacterium]